MKKIKNLEEVGKLVPPSPETDYPEALASSIGEFVKELTDAFGGNELDDDIVELYALDSESELIANVIIEENLDDNIEFVERRFVYFTGMGEEGAEVKYFIPILYFSKRIQELDKSIFYIIGEELILDEGFKNIIEPHIENVYNEPWEKQYHEGNQF
jgi:hypothetical protein